MCCMQINAHYYGFVGPSPQVPCGCVHTSAPMGDHVTNCYGLTNDSHIFLLTSSTNSLSLLISRPLIDSTHLFFCLVHRLRIIQTTSKDWCLFPRNCGNNLQNIITPHKSKINTIYNFFSQDYKNNGPHLR